MTTVRHDDERAHIDQEGRVSYEVRNPPAGWDEDGQPSGMIQRLARASATTRPRTARRA